MYTNKGRIFIKLKPHDKGYAVIPMQYKNGMVLISMVRRRRLNVAII
ncbi:hypothetical protein [Macrococcoides canis]|nr:hypothetical protein [Macrococcus canis]MEE1107418.1 hypothetical protein [Macrococcus canis]